MKPSMTFDNLYNEMAYLKYEFVYGTYDFSQQKIIWDILYNYIVSLHECFGVSSVCLNQKMTWDILYIEMAFL